MSTPQVLRLAVCLFPQVTALDYQGPIELLSFLSTENITQYKDTYFAKTGLPKYAIEATYLAENLDPVKPLSGPLVNPDRTFEDAKDDQFDIVLVPGGTYPEPV